MKILMTCDMVGGVWQYATDLTDALVDQGAEVVLAVLGPAFPLASRGEGAEQVEGWRGGVSTRVEIVQTNLPLDWLATGSTEVQHTATTLAHLARDHHADIVHLNSPTLATAHYPAPVVAVAHGCVGTWWQAAYGTAPDASYVWHGDLTRAGLLAADATAAPTAAYAATLQRHYALPTAPIAIHNGRAPLPLLAAEPADHVLTAGRLWDRVKNTALLDATAALLPVPLRAAGPTEAPHGESVAPQHLHLLGILTPGALAAELARTPIFVSAASFEPFGLAVLEAAQAGCPLILSDIHTFRELWTGAALFVPDQKPQAYAAAIDRVRTEPGLRAHLSQAAQARAARYTPAACATAMLALYRSVLADERAAA